MDIKIEDRSRIKKFFHKLHSKFEDTAFSIIQRIPDRLLPQWFMNRLERYLDKRIRKLKQQSIKMAWQNISLQKTVDNIRKFK